MRIVEGMDVLEFWRKNEKFFTNITSCAYVLGGQTSEAPSERAFKELRCVVGIFYEQNGSKESCGCDPPEKSLYERNRCEVQQEAMLTKDKPRAIISTLLTVSKQKQGQQFDYQLWEENSERRNIANVEPANPKSLRELQISASFATINNENCLNTTGWNGEERILIVSTNRCLDLLVAIPKWGCDATYEVVPSLFGQLWIIYARLAHTYAPMVFVLMNRCFSENKTQRLFFHFRQSLIRNICSKNKVLYESDEEFRNWTNLIAALAFVPVKDVSEAFEIIRDHSEQSEYAEELCLFLDYFEDTYVGRIKKGTERKKLRYAIEKWSVHQLMKENEPQTNNGIESFNGQLLRTMACSHPTVWKLLTAVLDELVLADQRVSSYWSGGSTPRRNNAYLQLSERLRKTVQRYSTQPKIEYLKSIAHKLGGFLVEKKNEKLQPGSRKAETRNFSE
uniref:Transposase n=1 Tax=Ditylenchus dipsaci TaxID=166011 RepID=A0A915DTQ7_9BILA